MTGLATVAIGTAGPDPAAFTRNGPSFFADPAAWAVTAAAAQALSRVPPDGSGIIGSPGTAQEDATAVTDSTGIIVISRQCTSDTMAAIARGAGRGFVSPLRFAGSNPGVLAGLACITWRLRGPSLVIATDDAVALPVADVVARSWLDIGHANRVLVAIHAVSQTGHTACCAVVRAARTGERSGGLASLRRHCETARP